MYVVCMCSAVNSSRNECHQINLIIYNMYIYIALVGNGNAPVALELVLLLLPIWRMYATIKYRWHFK